MDKRKVAVIGGGAAGMMAGITAAREGCHVTILEGNDRLGKKILATGNGKCNLGNLELTPDAYFCGSEAILQKCLKCFDQRDTIHFFNEIGLMVKEKGGYLYPVCEQASAVLDVLRTEVSVQGITVITEAKVNYISGENGKQGNKTQIEIGWAGERRMFEKVILACGSKASPKTGSDGSGYKLARQLGHKVALVVPALVQLKCSDDCCKALGGIRTEASLTVWNGKSKAAQERGEIQMTEYGISGIPVFQLSRIVNYCLGDKKALVAELDFLPDMTSEEYKQLQKARMANRNGRTAEEFFTGMLHKKLMMLFLKMACIKPDTSICDVSPNQIQQVYELCRSFRLNITGSNSFDSAQICAGGVDMKEVTPNLESERIPGVYFAGELLDVDGRCGGYNLQWAWSSGYTAGKAAAK